MSNKTIEEILLEKFNVYRNSESGQYHNGRQADAVVPFTGATQAIHQLISQARIDTIDVAVGTLIFEGIPLTDTQFKSLKNWQEQLKTQLKVGKQ